MCLFVFCIGQGITEVADFQSLRHQPSPRALAANHVSRSYFSTKYTHFNYLLLFWWKNLGTYKGKEERYIGLFVACKQTTKKLEEEDKFRW